MCDAAPPSVIIHQLPIPGAAATEAAPLLAFHWTRSRPASSSIQQPAPLVPLSQVADMELYPLLLHLLRCESCIKAAAQTFSTAAKKIGICYVK